MSARAPAGYPTRHEHDARDDAHLLQQRWHGWGSPAGLGVGLLSVGGFFVQLALGLSVLASIG
jgi:hypothetical protein